MDTQDPPSHVREDRMLILAADPEELKVLESAVAGTDIRAQLCADVEDLCRGMNGGAVLVVAAAEALAGDAMERVSEEIRRQADWSDLSILLLADRSEESEEPFQGPDSGYLPGNAVVLERPVGRCNLTAAVQLALRARGGQNARRDERAAHARSERSMRIRSSRLGRRVRAQSDVLRLMRDVATAANFAESVEEALSFALAQVCRFTGWEFGHAYRPCAEDPETLVVSATSYEHARERYKAFRDATLRLRIARGDGLTSRVYSTGHPEWSRSLQQELDEERARLVGATGITAVAVFPIMSGTAVAGVLEFFSVHEADPDPQLLDAMGSIGTQLGRVIERAKADHALRESHEFIRRISDTSPTMIRVLKLDTRRYSFVNGRMADFWGKKPSEIIGTGFEDFLTLVHPNDVDQATAADEDVRRGGGKSVVAWQVRARDAEGRWRWLRTWSVLFSTEEDAEPDHVLSISIDVTEHVEAEERLKQTDRLTSIGTLAAGIAHEINNPLASVVMTAQILLRRGLDPKSEGMLAELIEDAKRCGRIVRSVQHFAQKEPSERRSLNLNIAVRAAEELLRTDLRHAGITATLELSKDLPSIAGDAMELEQAVVNLMTNAAHASKSGQEILVRSTACNGSVQLTVQDQGQGMPPDVKRHAFDPFYTTRGREGGAGLGLSITHGIIEDHGGTIEIESTWGHGTTVTITLPVETGAD